MQTIRTSFIALLLLTLVFSPVGAFAATTKASGSIDESSLTTSNKKPTITGETDGVRTIKLSIKNEKGKTVYTSREIKVRNDTWKVKVSKNLSYGTYEVILKGPSKKLATETLTISKKGSTSFSRSSAKGSIAVSAIPLLMGGTATRGASVPVAYLKVTNLGTASTTIDGVTLVEKGSAPDNVVVGFSTSDDKGGSRSTTSNVFKNGLVTVPLNVELAPGQMRIYTIKAILGQTGSYGRQLMIDTSAVDFNGSVKGVFPIRGTTWTLGF
jgi:hypothetical protein